MRFCLAISSFLIVCAGTSHAEIAYTSSAGHDYSLSCNSNGYVLNSIAPVSRFLGQGASTYIQRQTEVIYLGQSCDAFSELLGNGQWCWANGGFLAIFPKIKIGFPRQELFCSTPQDPGAVCRCGE